MGEERIDALFKQLFADQQKVRPSAQRWISADNLGRPCEVVYVKLCNFDLAMAEVVVIMRLA